MKQINIVKRSQYLLLWCTVALTACFQSCEEYPDAFEPTEGVPEVVYVRMPAPESADSLITAAYMENTIVLVGSNLTSIREIYFNDQKAVLNTSFITSNTLFVNVPRELPGLVTDKVYMVTTGRDTVSFDFEVLIPPPFVNQMSNEYAFENQVAMLYGDYFIDDPEVPLSISFPGGVPVTEIISIEKTQVAFRVPEGAEKGYLSVSSVHGTSRSKFQYRDDRGMILDWDDLDAAGGWRPGVIRNNNPVESLVGNYVHFSGDIPGDNSDWDEDGFSFNLWGIANGRPKGDLFDIDPADALLKFEINVSEPWKANALQMIFTPWELGLEIKDEEGNVIEGKPATNDYIADGATPRALWYPWLKTGSYQTDGWVTVSIPLSDFKYNHEGKELEEGLSKGDFGGLTFFVYHGGVAGEACSPQISIDNIRVVPAE